MSMCPVTQRFGRPPQAHATLQPSGAIFVTVLVFIKALRNERGKAAWNVKGFFSSIALFSILVACEANRRPAPSSIFSSSFASSRLFSNRGAFIPFSIREAFRNGDEGHNAACHDCCMAALLQQLSCLHISDNKTGSLGLPFRSCSGLFSLISIIIHVGFWDDKSANIFRPNEQYPE